MAITAYNLIYGYLRGDATTPRFADFFGLWTFGGFAMSHIPATIYDPLALQAFQKGVEPAFTATYPFFYPPSFLLVTAPLAFAALGASWLIWSAISLALYVVAIFGRRWRPVGAIAALAAPTTLICLVAGQSGLLAGALMLRGMAATAVRPWLGGALLGLLTVKPQLGLLLPVALIAAGRWRAIAGAALTAIVLALATGIAFGWEIWTAWVRTIPLGVELVLWNRDGLVRLMPTVTAGLYHLGMADGPARLVQLAVSLAAIVATWVAFRRGTGPDAVAVLAMASFLVTPYAFVYDMPMVSGALLLSALARPDDRTAMIVFGLIAVVPAVMVATDLPLVEPILLACGVGLVLRRIFIARAAEP